MMGKLEQEGLSGFAAAAFPFRQERLQVQPAA